jgi:hypothetical protein
MMSKLKTAIKLIIYYFINLAINPSKEIKPKSLLLICLDRIGKFMLKEMMIFSKFEAHIEYNFPNIPFPPLDFIYVPKRGSSL